MEQVIRKVCDLTMVAGGGWGVGRVAKEERKGDGEQLERGERNLLATSNEIDNDDIVEKSPCPGWTTY